jgi:phosphoglycolate phosphatase-like HAD superfamily hydrolase
MGQAPAPAPSPSPARAALEEAKRVHRALGARYEDLVALVGRTKADIMVGQAAQAVEAAKAALNA